MKEYSSYTTADFLNDELFLFWYYSGEGDYYRKIIADCPDREPYLKEAMERLAALKWEKPVSCQHYTFTETSGSGSVV